MGEANEKNGYRRDRMKAAPVALLWRGHLRHAVDRLQIVVLYDYAAR